NPDVPGNWFMTFDLTYWHAKLGGTEYAYSIQSWGPPGIQQSAPRFPIDGDVKAVDFSWDMGIKVGLGYKTPHDNWDVYAHYTWYQTEDSASSFKAAPSMLLSLKSIVSFPASHVKSHMNVDYNNVELELARSYAISSKVSLRPHFDVKSAWIDLSQNTTYTISGYPTNFDNLGGGDFKTKNRMTFWGIGPRAGLDSKWALGYGFHLFGDVAASVLYGNFKSLHREFVPLFATISFHTDSQRIYKISDKFHRYVPFAQMFLGLGWDRRINNNKFNLGLKLGYEVQYYWRINQFNLPGEYNQGNAFGKELINVVRQQRFEKVSEDLMFYGITGEARVDF
ncbi:MAG: MOMP family protein, partial [Chlamydiia bacterium]|nr:MOMP family protein [Chlamydiia bacterium]